MGHWYTLISISDSHANFTGPGTFMSIGTGWAVIIRTGIDHNLVIQLIMLYYVFENGQPFVVRTSPMCSKYLLPRYWGNISRNRCKGPLFAIQVLPRGRSDSHSCDILGSNSCNRGNRLESPIGEPQWIILCYYRDIYPCVNQSFNNLNVQSSIWNEQT